MEPHDEFAGGGAEEDFGTFEDTVFLEIGFFIGDGEGDAAVGPVEEVGGGIDVDADLGFVSGGPFGFVFAEPVVGVVVEEDSAAVGVDGDGVVVGPEVAGVEGGLRIGCERGFDGACGDAEEERGGGDPDFASESSTRINRTGRRRPGFWFLRR